MLFKTSYDTTVGSISDVKKTDISIREALITTRLAMRSLGLQGDERTKACFVVGGETGEVNIPSFAHPLLVKGHQGKNYLVTDLRLFLSKMNEHDSDKDLEKNIRNRTEYNLVKSRATLNLEWLLGEQDQLRSRFMFAGTVYAAWLANVITKAYALDFADQTKIQALTLYFYHTLFAEDAVLKDERLETVVIHTIKATKMPAKEIYTIFEALGEMKGIKDYCSEVARICENVRLKDFNIMVLLTLIRNTWFGTNAKEILQVALEHPPTWIALVYASTTERTFKNSPLYKIVETQGRRGGSDEFRMNMLHFMDEQVVTESLGLSDPLSKGTDIQGIFVPDFKDD